MKGLFSFALILAVVNVAVGADVADLDTALQNTYYACVDIDQDLNDMKKMAGINTAVSGVATGLGVGATVAGFSKSKIDKQTNQWKQELEQMIQNQNSQYENTMYQTINISGADLRQILTEHENTKALQLQKDIADAEKRSKKLGNWRTGLLAGNTTVNVVGAIMSNKNKVDSDLQHKVDNCVKNLKSLKSAIVRARIEEIDVSEAQNIYNECADYEYLDLSPITKRAKGATVSSTIGAIAAGVGTATSIAANSDKMHGDDKEKTLNVAANTLAVGSSIASATATVFNATQIAAIKKVVNVSEKCTKVLK